MKEKKNSNGQKDLKKTYTQSLQEELEGYFRLKTQLNYYLTSPRVYYSDLKQMIENLWSKENMIIILRGTIYNYLNNE